MESRSSVTLGHIIASIVTTSISDTLKLRTHMTEQDDNQVTEDETEEDAPETPEPIQVVAEGFQNESDTMNI